MIVLSRETAKDLSKDTQSIINLIMECQNQLTRQDILAYFKSHSDAANELLNQAQSEVKSFPIVLRGLREKLNSDILPPIGDMDHHEGWLTFGDVFVGVTGACHTYPYDRPYQVSAVLPDGSGYEWRYVDDAKDISRPPMRLDPGLRLYAWWHLPIENKEKAAEEIKNTLGLEIGALTEYVNYLRNFSI